MGLCEFIKFLHIVFLLQCGFYLHCYYLQTLVTGLPHSLKILLLIQCPAL